MALPIAAVLQIKELEMKSYPQVGAPKTMLAKFFEKIRIVFISIKK